MIKLSSFSIANLSLGIGGKPASPRNSASSTAPNNTVTDNNRLHHPQFPGSSSSRSQVPESSSKPIIYLTQPNQGAGGSSYMVWEDRGVDGKASDYIRKVHEQNRYVSDEASSTHPLPLPPFLLPSPPRVVK